MIFSGSGDESIDIGTTDRFVLHATFTSQPGINGEFSVPVVSLHTLGDLFVPFKMEQVYATRAKAKGNDKWLVQRAIRDVGHCAFTAAEAAAAFDAMVKWEAGGPKPAGDDVLTPSVVADPKYGCAFTVNTPNSRSGRGKIARLGLAWGWYRYP